MPGARRRRKRGSWGATYARRTKSFIQPSLLLLLEQAEGHGYGLMESLKTAGLADDSLNPSVVYRGLREMEERGWVTSRWDTEGSGPSRRVYRITPQGSAFLQSWASELQEMRGTLERFVQTYAGGQQEEGA